MAEQTAKHILVVEDDSDIQLLLVQLFESDGYQVSKAGNGQEALQVLEQTDSLPNVILLDLMMPLMDGYAFREVQKQDPRLAKIPVVVMSADGQIQAKTERIGAQAHLRKPFANVTSLLNTVHQCLNGFSGASDPI